MLVFNCLTVVLEVKNPSDNAGDAGNSSSIPGSERSPVGGHDNPLQHSCLENPMDRGAWWDTVQSVAKSRTRLKQLSTHALYPTRLLCPWDFPGKNTGVGCNFLLQGIFLTLGSNPHLLSLLLSRQILLLLSHPGRHIGPSKIVERDPCTRKGPGFPLFG